MTSALVLVAVLATVALAALLTTRHRTTRKDHPMTDTPTPKPAALTPAQLDPDSPHHVPPELRPYYASGPETEAETETRLADRQWLSRRIGSEERARARREADAAYSRDRATPGRTAGTKIRGDFESRAHAAARDREQQRTAQGWTPELRAVWLHEHRLRAAARAHQEAERIRAGIANGTCAICGEYRPGRRVVDRPLPTGHRARCCDDCERVIILERDRRLAEQPVAAGRTRADAARDWLDQHRPTR